MHNNPHAAWKSSVENGRTRETRNERSARWLAAILLLGAIVLTVWLAGCGSLSGGIGNGSKGLPVAAVVELSGPDGTTNGWAMYDGDLLIAQNGDVTGRAMLIDKTTGITLAIVEFTAKNQTLIQSRRRDFKGKFARGETVPAFVTENYPRMLLERYGLIIEGETTTEELAKRPRPPIQFVPQPHNGG